MITRDLGRSLVIALATTASCGDLAVDGHYLGESLLEIEGTVTLDARDVPAGATGDLRVALFWARPTAGDAATGNLDSVTAVEQDVGAASTFPARYTLTVHEPPPDELIGTLDDVSGEFAIAMLLVYLDTNGDGSWDRGVEDLVGAATDAIVLYTPDGLTGGRYGTLAPGFHVLRTTSGPVSCEATLTGADASEVPIVVDMRFPAAALGDLDCDGVAQEWSGACPAPSTILALCRDNPSPSVMCETCEDLLWDDGSPDSRCDEWLAACDQFANSHECHEAWEHCRDLGRDDECAEHPDDCPPPPPG